MSITASQSHKARIERGWDHLLLSLPNAVVASRIRLQAQAAGLAVDESAMGLRIACDRGDWQLILQSIGLSLSPAERRETLVAAVRKGDDDACIHHSIFRARSLELLMAELSDGWLKQVLANERIIMHFQPLVQHPPGRMHGYECLARGLTEEGEIIPPNRLFDAARRLGKVADLDRACRHAAIRAAAKICAAERQRLRFFINVIPNAMEEPRQALSETMNELNSAGLRPEQIVFELVETEEISRASELLDILCFFRKVGVRVALDDVGAGYSSLLWLSRLRPDYIKLDGELVRRAAESGLEAKLVRDLAETARQNGIIAIAEGIETARHFQLAVQSGIRITQGFFHARPRPTTLTEPEIGRMLEHAGCVIADGSCPRISA